MCTYKYSQVGELPASLKHRSSLYTQCLKVGLAGRITTVLGKEKGEEREIPLYGTGLLDLIPFRNQCLSFHHNTRVNSPMKLLLDDTMTVGVYHQACSGIPLAVGFVGRDRRLWNSMVQETQIFRQVRAASCVIPYVMCGGLYCLRC